VSPPSRRRLLGALALAAITAAGGLLASAPLGWADAPAAYGWWYAANAGLPVPPPAPPSVPPDGLYVANDVSGPAAIAALSIPVPSGAGMGPLVLHVAGTPLMSQPPVACPLRSSFKPAQAGAWSDRPTYDCAQSEKIGTVDAAKTTVTFDASPFLRDGAVGVVILAGGPTDQVAFNKPGPDTLPVSTAPGAVTTGPGDAGAAAASVGGDVGTSAPPAISATPYAGLDLGPPAAAQPQAGPPVAGGSSPRSAGAAPRGSFAATSSVAAKPSGWRARVGELVGAAAVLVALVAWTEGYGLLGGRVQSLASPLGPGERRSRGGYARIRATSSTRTP
jgi:hypothetical protein